jgi:hypothetical protein
MPRGEVGIRVIRARAKQPPPPLLRGRWPLQAPNLKIRNSKPESRQALPQATGGTARGENSCVIVPSQFCLIDCPSKACRVSLGPGMRTESGAENR